MKFVNYRPSVIIFYDRQGDILLQEISLLAVSADDAIAALGNEVNDKRDEILREGLLIGSPLKNGVVAEFEMSKKMFTYFFRKAGISKIWPPRTALCVPVDMTEVETRAWVDLMYSVGAKPKKLLMIEAAYPEAIPHIPNHYTLVIEISPTPSDAGVL